MFYKNYFSGQKETKDDAVKVVVMSFAQYCRYRGIMKRLEHVQDKWLKHTIVNAIGGVMSPTHNCHVMFCRDTFFHPELEEFELRCDHFGGLITSEFTLKRIVICVHI